MRPPLWAEALLGIQLDPREEEMIVGDFREEFLDIAARQGRARATVWYCLQTVSFLREGGAKRILGLTSVRPLCVRAAVWLVLFTIAAVVAQRTQPFNPVPVVIAYLAIVPLAALHMALRSGYLRTGLFFGAALGFIMFLLGALATKALHLPSPPLTVLPGLPIVTVVAFAATGAAFGRRFQNFGGLRPLKSGL